MLKKQNIEVLGETARNVVNILRESKTEINERLKLELHYGLLDNIITTLKTMSFRFRFKGDPVSRATSDLGKSYKFNSDLNAKLNRIRYFSDLANHIFDIPPNIAFLSYNIPRADRTSSQFRLTHILKILLEKGCKICLLYPTSDWNDIKYLKAFEGDINFTHLPLNLKGYVQFIADYKPQYVWITELWRINYVKFITKLVEELKVSCPSSQLIVDTIDFHYKEFYRKYELTGNSDDLNQANEFLDNEKVLYRSADTVVVISEEEKKDIQDKIAAIRRVETIPNIHEILYDVRPYSKRKNICFVGHFGNKHNVDAVIYFIENIFHLILEKNPGVELHVLGYSADRYKKHFEFTNVKVIGRLKYLGEALTYYKLFVCPMIYGAGMKGKIGGAIAAGVPVVTTSIGAEGFPFRNGEECYIADIPSEFAARCNQCLEDPHIWYNLSIKASLMVAENFSPAAVACKLEKIFFDDTNIITLTH